MKLLRGTLDALEILAKSARDGLVDGAGRVGVVWHAGIDGFSREIARFVILEGRVGESQPPARTAVPRSTVPMALRTRRAGQWYALRR